MGLGTIFVIVTATFFLVHLSPGDPARFWVDPSAGAEELAAARRALGLDRPLIVRYGVWLAHFVTGDWGISLAHQRPVTAVIAGALPHTVLLASASLVLTYLLGGIIGVVQARRRGSTLDTTLTVASVAVFGMPAYWLAIVLVLVFGYGAARWDWPAWLQLPTMGATSLDADLYTGVGRVVDRMRHLTLPLVTLTLIGAAGAARYVRGAVLDVRSLEFVRGAHAKGLAPRVVEVRHVLRNALIPIVTLLGLALPALVSGTVFVEVIFAWPGMGRVMVDGVGARDYPVLMAATTMFAILVVVGNLLADLLTAAVDPRVRDRL